MDKCISLRPIFLYLLSLSITPFSSVSFSRLPPLPLFFTPVHSFPSFDLPLHYIPFLLFPPFRPSLFLFLLFPPCTAFSSFSSFFSLFISFSPYSCLSLVSSLLHPCSLFPPFLSFSFFPRRTKLKEMERQMSFIFVPHLKTPHPSPLDFRTFLTDLHYDCT